MKKSLKVSIAMFLSIITILNFSMISFADTIDYENERNTIEVQSRNRFTYKTVRSKPVTRKKYTTASQARNQDLAVYAAVGILALSGPIGAGSSIALAVGNAIYDMNTPGYVLTKTTVVKRYKVHMLTGKKYLVDTRSEIKVKVYAKESKGYSLHRSFSFNLRHR